MSNCNHNCLYLLYPEDKKHLFYWKILDYNHMDLKNNIKIIKSFKVSNDFFGF